MTPIENYVNTKKTSKPLGFLEDVRYKDTKDLASATYMARISEPTIVVIPYWNNLLIFSPVILIGGIITYQKIPTHHWFEPLTITLLIAAVLIFLAIKAKLRPQVTLSADSEKLVIKTSTFYWKDTVNTYVMTERTAKKTYKALLIENLNGSINSTSLHYIHITDSKLASIIEYYKTKHHTRQ